jgi:hypothetical protein
MGQSVNVFAKVAQVEALKNNAPSVAFGVILFSA